MERRKESKPIAPRRAKVPRVVIPPYRPPTGEELKRRKQAAAQILRLREEMGSIGTSVIELIREDRDSH